MPFVSISFLVTVYEKSTVVIRALKVVVTDAFLVLPPIVSAILPLVQAPPEAPPIWARPVIRVVIASPAT